jgi:hypothetical protein
MSPICESCLLDVSKASLGGHCGTKLVSIVSPLTFVTILQTKEEGG